MGNKPTYEELEQRVNDLENETAERKRAEEALRENEKIRKESDERYRTILENIIDAYYEVDFAGDLTFFNDSLLKMTGLTKDELIGLNYTEYMDEKTAKKIYEIFQKVYDTGEPIKRVEYEILKGRDGSKRCVESSVSLIRDSTDQPIGFRGIMRDVTERKQIEAELTQTRNFLQNILDSSIDGITTTDLSGEIKYTSPMVKDMIGYSPKAVNGKKVYEFYGNGIEDAKKIMKELSEKGEVRNHEMNLIRSDGGLIEIIVSATFLKDEKGEPVGILGVYKDITEKNILEAQLEHAQRMEAIGTLAGGIAHNFNNMLMAIIGNTSLMLLETDCEHPNFKRLKNIEKQVQSGSNLTSQLLGYAREGRYKITPISLNRWVKETAFTFGMTRKEIRFHLDLAESLYGIKADQGQIEQVLLNLYVNAADAMPGGGDLFLKTVNLTHKGMRGRPYRAKTGNYILLTVRDTGVGMDKKTTERIFDPFFTTKGLARGTGLGLASVYGIIKGHGGYIDVDSEEGHGTTFSIYLPATEKEIKEENESLTSEILKGKETVLFVDDEEMVIDAGEQMLITLGYEVLLAGSGQEALDIYKKNQEDIDIVLLDMVLPGMGGGETFDRMREINPGVKVLLSSGYSLDGEAKDILERGCDAFIQKPFNMEGLSQNIRKTLDKIKGTT